MIIDVLAAMGTLKFHGVAVKPGKPTAALRTVKLGDVVGNAIAVREGLHDGERVVVTGATLVVDGDKIPAIDDGLRFAGESLPCERLPPA